MITRTVQELQKVVREALIVDDHATALLCVEELKSLGTIEGSANAEEVLGDIATRCGEYHKALQHYSASLPLYQEIGVQNDITGAHINIGIAHYHSANFPSALDHWSVAQHQFEQEGNMAGIASILCNLGHVYAQTGNYPLALDHYHRAITLHEEAGNWRFVAFTASGLGGVHRTLGNYDLALSYHQRCLTLHEEEGSRLGAATAFLNIGAVYESLGDFDRSLEYHNRALALHKELDFHGMILRDVCNIVTSLIKLKSFSEAEELHSSIVDVDTDDFEVIVQRTQNHTLILIHHGRLDEAVSMLLAVLSQANDRDMKQAVSDIHGSLRDLALLRNDFKGYVEHNDEFTRIKEEINGRDTATKIAMQEKQREIDAREREHAQQMAVLHSTLPRHIADRVARGEVVNDSFDNASVLFLDVVGFTTHSSELDAKVVVELLQKIFTVFDAICGDHDVTKIKTIGDSYMAVAFDRTDTEGARPLLAHEQEQTPNVMPSEDEAQQLASSEQRIANAAQAMMTSEFTWPHTEDRVMFRIGLHCGPVVAGVLGTHRMQYDVWGDTVNVASRMESTSEPGRIHVSEALAAALSGSTTVALTLRGETEVKGKGTMQTYWLESVTS